MIPWRGVGRVTVAAMKRHGFSLVECVVAAVLLSAGLLAIAASGRAMQQMDLLGGRTALAAEMAASRIASLRADPCAGPSSGSAAGLFDERWSVGGSGPLRTMSLDIGFVAGNRAHTVRYQAAWWCPP